MKFIVASALLAVCAISSHISSTSSSYRCVTGSNGVQPHDLLDYTGECRCPASFHYEAHVGCVLNSDSSSSSYHSHSSSSSSEPSYTTVL